MNQQMSQYMAAQQQMDMMRQVFANPSQAMQNLMQQNMQQMINQQLTDWQEQHPAEFSQLQNQFSGKSRAERVKILRSMAKKSNINLDQYSGQFGIAL